MEFQFHAIDIVIIVSYLVTIIAVGWFLSKRASKDLDSYFLAVTSVIMKFTWYDKLGPGEMYMPEDE